MRCPKARAIVCVLLVGVCTAAAAGQSAPFAQAEAVFTATLDNVQWGPVAQSMPPIYSATLTVMVKETLRRAAKPGGRLTLHFRARTKDRPLLPVDETVLVATEGGGKTVKAIEVATAELLAKVRLATC